MTTLGSPTHLHAASPFYLFVQMSLYPHPKQLWICECKEEADNGDSRNSLALTSLSWPHYQNCGPILKLPIAQYHKWDSTQRGDHPHSTLVQPFTSQGLKTSPNGWAVTQPSAGFHRALWEYTKYFKWEDTWCSQCQTQNQCMVGGSQVLTLRLHLTWLNTKALCWQRNKSLPKTYSNYGCSQGPYKHQVPLPSSCVSFSFSNRILKRSIVFWVRRL